MATKFSYVGKFSDSGSKNAFYKVSGKPYGFKSFPNKSLATFAHAVQSHLAPYTAPKVYSPVCKIRIPNYFIQGMRNGNIKYRKEMVLSEWGYLTEIAKPFVCGDDECGGECAYYDLCPNYYIIQDIVNEMMDHGIEYNDAHEGNFGYVTRGKKKILVPIDFGRESIASIEDGFPEVCWEGAEDMECGCNACMEKYGYV